MKYWLLTTEYPPFYGGGISTYCYHTACMLAEKGHLVTIFINDETIDTIKIDEVQEARIIRFNPNLTQSHSFLGYHTNISFEFSAIVKSFIEKEGKPDFIESQDYNGIAYFLLQNKYCLYDWCKNISIVITVHSPSFLYMEYNEAPLFKQPNYWIGEMERFCIQAADLIISPSDYIIAELRKKFIITNENIHTIPNPYKIRKPVANLDQCYANNNITFYGKLSAQKGSFKILEKFEALWNKGFNKQLLMVGGQDIVYHPLSKTMGSIIKKQYSKIIRKGLLKLEGKITPKQLQEHLTAYCFFVVPSIVDNLPYVVLELMGQGKIVIVSESGGQSEIISDKEDGFIFNYENENHFELVLNEVLALSTEKRRNISDKAIIKIEENYSYEKIYTKKINLLQRLSEGNSRIKLFFPTIRSSNIANQQFGSRDNDRNSILSVIIPYYNLGKYVDETINSVLKSTYSNIEVLLINDGSSDKLSLDKLNKYQNHPIIKVISKRNSGLAETRNYGALMAKGDYIAFLDADDTVENKYFEKAVEILTHYKNINFVGCWTNYFGDSKASWPTFNPEPPIILTHNTINSSALVYKKDAFLKFGKNDPNFKIGLEDYESVISMLAAGMNGVAIPDFLFNYRVRKKSMIKGVTKEIRKKYYLNITEKHHNYFLPYKNETDKLISYNYEPLNTDNATLDDLPFKNIPIANKIAKNLIHKTKSNPKLKKQLLKLKKIVSKK